MRYLKLFESFDKGVKEWDSDWRTRRHIVSQTHGTDFFTKRELDFFRQFFVKTERNDFFRVSGEKLSGRTPDGTPLSGERRSTFKARYMPGDNKINPIEILITRLKDDYFMVNISCMNKEESRFSEYSIGNTPRSKIYLVDTFEDLKCFLYNIYEYWKKINNSWRPMSESKDYQMYEPIDYKTFQKYVGGERFSRLMGFNQEEINLIKKYKGNFYFKLDKHYSNSSSQNQITLSGDRDMVNLDWFNDKIWSPIQNTPKYLLISILKSDDEFYIACVGAIYVLCDQLSGLESLLKDLIITKST